jgi:hypothetical protein
MKNHRNKILREEKQDARGKDVPASRIPVMKEAAN